MTAAVPPYCAYKDSGVPWLGRIPAHWMLMRGKWLFRSVKEINSDRRNTNVLSLTLRGVVNNDLENPEGLVPKDYATYQFFAQGDLVFKLIDLENLQTSRVGLVHEDGIMSSAYVRLIPTHKGVQRFYFHQYFDLYQRGVFNQLGAGVRSTLGQKDLLEIPIVVPDLDEQHAITRYLDHMDRRIRRYIRAKQKLIALLEEQKQAIIHQAVTRGLDPSVRLKPSGVAWLGDVPEHWEVMRSKYLFREIDTRSLNGDETRLSMSQKFGLIPSTEIEEKRLLSESSVGGKLCERGDLVLNRLKAHLGVFALASQQGIVSPDYTVFRPRLEMVPQYFEAVYRTPACRVELRQRAKGIVQGFWRLYTDDFSDIRVPVPPVSEQREIIERWDIELSDLARAIARTQREIALLREYRTRLIADVVTGQVDVRAAAAQLPEEVEETDTLDEEEEPTEDEEGGNLGKEDDRFLEDGV